MTSKRTDTACPLCSGPTRRVYRHPEAQLRRCARCDHCFADTSKLAERVVYDLSYGDESHKNWFENPNTRLFNRIERTLVAQGCNSVIDLACGRADFLRHLRRNHPDWRLLGVEQTPFPAPDGVEIVIGDVATVEVEERFDAVVSLAAIEHMEDPIAFLRLARARCRPGGWLVVMTLNERSVLYGAARLLRNVGLTGPFDQLYSKHHLHHFNKTSLREALRQVGLEIALRYDHHIPTSAIDFAKTHWLADAVRLNGARACFALGAVTRRCYLQTVFVRVAFVESRR